MGEKKVIREVRGASGTYDVLVDDDQVQDIFVDGYVGQTIGISYIQTNFYRQVDEVTKDGISIGQRLIKLRLIMPTNSFLEMCIKSLAGIAESEKQFDDAFEAYKKEIMSSLPKVTKIESGEEEAK